MTDMKFDPVKAKAKTAKKKAKKVPKVNKSRARPTAKEATKAARRRRKGGNPSARGKLSLDTSKLDPAYHYRWAEDRPGRLNELTVQDDYDIVETNDHESSEKGSGVVRPSGENKMVLLRKRRSFYEEDQAEKSARIKETQRQLEQGSESTRQLGDGVEEYKPRGHQNTLPA